MLGEKELPDDQTMDELRLKGYNKARPLVAHECMRITIQIPHGNTNSFSMDPKQTLGYCKKLLLKKEDKFFGKKEFTLTFDGRELKED